MTRCVFSVRTDAGLKNLRGPDEIIIEPTAPELKQENALVAVREVIARRHHFDPEDDQQLHVGHH